jgi:hypothetical protein
MARLWPIEFEGAFYHGLSRRNARESIFVDHKDREVVLDLERFRSLTMSQATSASFLARVQRLICASRFLASEKVGKDSE